MQNQVRLILLYRGAAYLIKRLHKPRAKKRACSIFFAEMQPILFKVAQAKSKEKGLLYFLCRGAAYLIQSCTRVAQRQILAQAVAEQTAWLSAP